MEIPTLKGSIFTAEEKEEAKRKNHVLVVSPMTRYTCPLRCLHCYTANEKYSKSLNLDAMKKILDETKKIGARNLRIAGLGEPFLDPMIYNPQTGSFPLIEYVRKLGIEIQFFTNGVLFNERPDLLEGLKDISLLFKLWGDPKTQEYLTGNKGYFREEFWIPYNGLLIPKGFYHALKLGFNNIEYDESGRPTVRVGFETSLFKRNKRFLPEFLRWARRNNVASYFEQPFIGGRMGENLEERVSDVEAFELSKQLSVIDRKEFGNVWQPGLPYLLGNMCVFNEARCDRKEYTLVIMPDGEVHACYGTPISYGNIHQASLKEILNHPDRRKLLGKSIRCTCHVAACAGANGYPISNTNDLIEAAKKYDYKNYA